MSSKRAFSLWLPATESISLENSGILTWLPMTPRISTDYGNAGAPSESEGHGRILLARARPLDQLFFTEGLGRDWE